MLHFFSHPIAFKLFKKQDPDAAKKCLEMAITLESWGLVGIVELKLQEPPASPKENKLTSIVNVFAELNGELEAAMSSITLSDEEDCPGSTPNDANSQFELTEEELAAFTKTTAEETAWTTVSSRKGKKPLQDKPASMGETNEVKIVKAPATASLSKKRGKRFRRKGKKVNGGYKAPYF